MIVKFIHDLDILALNGLESLYLTSKRHLVTKNQASLFNFLNGLLIFHWSKTTFDQVETPQDNLLMAACGML